MDSDRRDKVTRAEGEAGSAKSKMEGEMGEEDPQEGCISLLCLIGIHFPRCVSIVFVDLGERLW